MERLTNGIVDELSVLSSELPSFLILASLARSGVLWLTVLVGLPETGHHR